MTVPPGPTEISVLLVGGSARLREEVGSRVLKAGARIVPGEPALLIVLQDEKAGPAQCANVIETLRRQYRGAPLLFVATGGSESVAVAAFRAGASDYLRWPAEDEFERVWTRLTRVDPQDHACPLLLGDSLAMRSAANVIRRLALTPSNVLIHGETGTGKEVAAQLIHRWSRRAHSSFVAVNCGAIPETLFESEFFGYERGAFTGAVSKTPGKVRSADGGTLFLDEIGELTLSSQAKLLRAIEYQEIQPLGGRRPEHINVRWIAATNRDLESDVGEGRFRADLYYRLNVAEVAMPPLRERREDIPVIAAHFLRKLAAEFGVPPLRLSATALEGLMAHDWRGNVRELRNVIESSLIRGQGPEILLEDLPDSVLRSQPISPGQDVLERRQLIEALAASNCNKSEAAHRLHCSRMTLYRKLARYHIDVTNAVTLARGLVSQK